MEIQLNLAKLKHVVKTTKNKEGNDIQVLIIPIKENDLFLGEKTVSINLRAMELKEKRVEGKKITTHFIKQSVNKDTYNSMTEEQRNAMPIFGNLFHWEGSQQEQVMSQEIDDNIEIDEDMPLPF
jgi:hypothetical protein